MSNRNSSISRRQFITTAAKGAAAIPVVSLLAQPTWAADAPLIALDHPTAVALGYVHDAATVDTAKFPKFAEGQFCDNCLQYKDGDGEKGLCNILPGFTVAAKGWCNVWVAKP